MSSSSDDIEPNSNTRADNPSEPASATEQPQLSPRHIESFQPSTSSHSSLGFSEAAHATAVHPPNSNAEHTDVPVPIAPQGTPQPRAHHAQASTTSTTLPTPGITPSSQVDPEAAFSDRDIHEEVLDPLPGPSHRPAFLRPPNPTSSVTTSEDTSSEYFEFVQKLASKLPHLQNVRYLSKRDHTSVRCFDITNTGSHKTRGFDESNIANEGDGLREFLEAVPSATIKHRLILVEDLDDQSIDILGSHFCLSPEFFEEHLLNSGWRSGKYQDDESTNWPTNKLKRNYASLRWFRPVRMLNHPFNTTEAYEDLLDQSIQSFWWRHPITFRTKTILKTHPVWHQVQLIGNILRSAFPFTTTDAELLMRNSAVQSGGDTIPAVREERISTCTIQDGSLLVSVILLDPLPLINHWVKSSPQALMKLRFQPRSRFEGLQKLERINSQRPWPSIQAASSRLERISTASPLLDQTLPVLQVQETREEGILVSYSVAARAATTSPPVMDVNQQRVQDQNIEMQFDERRLFQREMQRSRAKRRLHSRPGGKSKPSIWARIFHNQGTRQPASGDEESTISGPMYDATDKTALLRPQPLIRCMYQNWSPRAPIIYGNLFSPLDHSKLDTAIELFAGATSTAYDLTCWLTADNEHGSIAEGIITTLLKIICGDIGEYTQLVESTLSHIEMEMLDDITIQRQLLNWQTLLEHIDRQCRATHASLTRFPGAVYPDLKFDGTPITSSLPRHDASMKTLVSQTLALLEGVTERRRAVSDALMANMNMIESEKGIAEAESVGKLTELAFVFIPISFAASIFGMQVRELDPSTTSISAFFVLSIISITLLYTARLIVRSESVRHFRRRILANMRASAGLAGRGQVPFFVFLRYAAIQSMKSTVHILTHPRSLPIIGGVGALVIVLLPVWLSSLDSLVKTGITIPVVLISAILLFIPVATFYMVGGGVEVEDDDEYEEEDVD